MIASNIYSLRGSADKALRRFCGEVLRRLFQRAFRFCGEVLRRGSVDEQIGSAERFCQGCFQGGLGSAGRFCGGSVAVNFLHGKFY